LNSSNDSSQHLSESLNHSCENDPFSSSALINHLSSIILTQLIQMI